MLGLKKKKFTLLFFWIDHLPEFGVQIFTIFHIEFAEKSQKIRTVALWYKKFYKKTSSPPPPPPQ